MKIAVVNLKGGVGKTIMSVHLAANLGRVVPAVLIDPDPQRTTGEEVRANMRTLRMTRETFAEMGVSVIQTEIPQRESYRVSFGTVPTSENVYGQVLRELLLQEVTA
ncbi:MAG: nucleotide-binding protein [Ferrimicrobium sp.]